MIDTAPEYGNGNSESIFGEAIEGRRDDPVVATEVGYRGSADDVVTSVEASLRRLRTDVIDVIQFHGRMYTGRDGRHILDDGLRDVLLCLRDDRWVSLEYQSSSHSPCQKSSILSPGFVVQTRQRVMSSIARIAQ